ncbi:MAG: ABC transporter substrate-binding protein, partial [Bdellovibrionales bacterium]|nr:ABC transporter substrate-binding protein [Bdellovibrionales bacterium]
MRIGVSVPLQVSCPDDADVQSVGTDVLQGLHFAQETLGSSHELLVRDNQNSPGLMRKIAEEFSALQVDAVVGLPTSDEVHLTAQVLDPSIPLFTPMATSPELAKYQNVFRTRCGDIHSVPILVEHIKGKAYSNIASISEDTAYAKDCAQLLANHAAAQEICFLSTTVKTHSRELGQQMREVLAANVDAAFLSSQDEEGYLRMLEVVRRFNPDLPVMGSAMPGSRKFQTLAGELANGIVYVSEPDQDASLTEYGKQYLKDYEARYGAPETGTYAISLSFA